MTNIIIQSMFIMLSFVAPKAPEASVKAHSANNNAQVLLGVTHCSDGAMRLNDSGWLTQGNKKVDFHAIMQYEWIRGLPSSTPIDANVFVCQQNDNLHYFVR
jgi:hypothetical protein